MRLNRTVTPRSCLETAQQRNNATRQNVPLDYTCSQLGDPDTWEHRAGTLRIDRAELPMLVIEESALATKRKDIAAEEKEGTETNGHQTLTIQAACCSSAAVFPERYDSQASRLQQSNVRSVHGVRQCSKDISRMQPIIAPSQDSNSSVTR